MQQLRLGIIGVGPIVEKKHLPALAEVPEIAVVAVCRRTEAPLHQIANRFRIAKRTTDYRAVLDDREVDAILLTTGPDTQPAIIAEAAAAGKHVFVEKPVAASAADARAIARTVHASGIHCQIGFNKRYYYGYRQVRQLIDAGQIGAPAGLSARFWYQTGRRDALLYNGIHFLDLVAFLAGPLTEVSAQRAVVPPANGGGVAETIAVSFASARNAVGTVLLSSGASWDYLNEHLDLVTADQSAVTVDNGRALRVFRKDDPQASRAFENTLSVHWWSGNDEQGFVPQLRVFAQRVLGTHPSPADAALHRLAADVDDGVRSHLVLEALKRSLAEGRSVVIKDAEVVESIPPLTRPQEALR
jgi:predicted dehydrogenase